MDMDADSQGAAELVAAVAAAVPRRAVFADVFRAIVREIPQLEEDKPLLALLDSSVGSNVETCLQIMQHRIDLSAVQAPAAAVEYARRLAQRGTPLTTLLRTYRLGHARFADWLLRELPRHADDAQVISATTLSMSRIVAAYIDQTSEEMVAAYTQEREHWVRSRNAAGRPGSAGCCPETGATCAQRRQPSDTGCVSITWAWCAGCRRVRQRGRTHQTGARGRPGGGAGGRRGRGGVPAPRRGQCMGVAPAGVSEQFDSAEASTAGVSADIRFAFGDPARGPGDSASPICRPALPRRLLSRQDLALLRRLPLPTSRPSR